MTYYFKSKHVGEFSNTPLEYFYTNLELVFDNNFYKTYSHNNADYTITGFYLLDDAISNGIYKDENIIITTITEEEYLIGSVK